MSTWRFKDNNAQKGMESTSLPLTQANAKLKMRDYLQGMRTVLVQYGNSRDDCVAYLTEFFTRSTRVALTLVSL
ncbi:hypothetical protein NEOLEDRAFT_1132979 [Neolentinus lepideus HHB14362 ss-1]|uniref:Uncharacterized protein n=1 Tax=Neolentinus lepideus HHB14362 ss-1 TaxID=1314782 RepID=A0A165T024_9AGAM|nr:hypothetical protein NEOLEDRAFT_1132979 [Neolentinus lepideus HHB14362 ss-1]